ncbi:hypothetical protein ES703_63870 [subsurface metagenome]
MRKTLSTIVFVLAALAAVLPVEPSPSPLRVAVVQFGIDESLVHSLEAFRGRIGEVVERAMAFEPDLIIFPEYTAAFTALIPYRRIVQQADSVLQGLAGIRKEEPLAGDLRELFLLNSGFAERVILEIFGSLAREHSVFILGGSYFAWERTRSGEVQLRNRAFLFGPDGSLIYSQDKVYLTGFESTLLKLSPGSSEQARAVRIKDYLVGITICRDTFFPAWEERLAGIDLWVDIKANGARYDEEQQEIFLRALPARIRSSDVPFGITACLTGRFLDLFWEGESSLVQKQGPSVRFLQRSESPGREELLIMNLGPPPRGCSGVLPE